MKKNLMNTLAACLLVLSLLAASCKKDIPTQMSPSQDLATVSTDRPNNSLSQQMEDIAATLSSFLADKQNRAFLFAQMKAAGKTHSIELGNVLAAVEKQGHLKGGERLNTLAENILKTETALKNTKAAVPRLDLVVPAETNRSLLETADAINVAVAPLTDEGGVQSIPAYANGKRLVQGLSALKAPDVPTLVIGPAERESITFDSEGSLEEEVTSNMLAGTAFDQPKSLSTGEDLVGIPNILITNDHEPWYKGDPEIYVHFRRWKTATGVFIDTKADLPGVNTENKWYFLGDPNSTYQRLNATYDKFMEIIVYEDDAWPDSDDVVGVFIPNWKLLSYSGSTLGTPLGTTKDAKIYLDRD
jgi:hypothetical protein